MILGGGICGLSLLWFLKNRFNDQVEFILLEKSDRVGGWIHTVKKDGFTFEQGPQCFTVQGALDALHLIEDIGLEKMAIGNSKKASKQFLYLNGKMQVIPNGFFDLFFSPFSKGLVSGLFHEWREPSKDLEDESIYDFISRRFNPGLADGMIGILLNAFLIGDLKKLSMKSSLPDIWDLEKEYGGVIRGLLSKKKSTSIESEFIKEIKKHLFVQFKEGLEMFPKALEKLLKPHIKLLNNVTKLKFSADKTEVILQNQETIVADHVFSTLHADELADLLEPEHKEITSLLNSIPFNSSAVINFGYRQPVLGNKNDGSGFSFSKTEKNPIIGILWMSSLFPQMNHIPDETRLTVMIGKDNLPKEFNLMEEKEFYEIALNELSSLLHIDKNPDASTIKVIKKGTSRYYVGHSKKIEQLEKEFAKIAPHFNFDGYSYYDHSIAGTIKHAKKSAEKFVL